MEDNNILLVFPPLIESISYPHAGIPSLVSYLKAHGYNPSVLDMDQLFKKQQFMSYRVLAKVESRILSFRKTGGGGASNVRQASFSVIGTLKQRIKKLALMTLRTIHRLKNFFLNIEPLPLDNVFEMLDSDKYYYKIEKLLKPILEREIKDKKIMGISVIYPNQILYSLILAKMAKEIDKNIFVLLGGSQITAHINKFIDKKVLTKHIDAFIVHEGELGLVALLDALKSDKPLNNIPNLYYKDDVAYKPSESVNTVMPVEAYMTPDFSGFDLKNYPGALLPIRTLRGCYWGKCRFCSYPHTSGKYGLTSAEFVVDSIIKLQKEYKINNFEFIDSSMPANFLRRIAERIIENNLKVKWFCRANFMENLKDIEFVKVLRKSGCDALSLGLESGNDRIMKYMKKMQKDKDSVLEIIRVLRSEDITPVLYVMIGFPTETKEEMEETIDFVVKLKKEYQCSISGVSVFNLVEHSYVFDNPQEFHITKIHKDSHPALQGYGYKYDIAKGLTGKELHFMQKKANFFLRYPMSYDIYRSIFKRAV